MKKIYESSVTQNTAAFICGLCLLLVILITSVQAVCYWIPDWWRNEYAKYDTPSNVKGGMSLDDAVHITEDMLDYCIGRLDTLDATEAEIGGVTAPFFTEREKSHLSDCRGIFLAAVRCRVIALLLIAAFSTLLYVHLGKQKAAAALARGYLRALAAALIFAALVTAFAVHDFTRAFTVFHHIFFDNDLWILYPDKDNLINIMQEEVFSDAAIWIASIFTAVSLAAAAACAYVLRTDSRGESVIRQN